MSDTTENQFDGSIEQAVGLIVQPDEPEEVETKEVETEEVTDSEDATPEMEASEEVSDEVDDAEVDDSEEEEVEVEAKDSDEEADDEADSEEPVWHTVKVDGVEEQVSLEDLKRGYSGQKYIQKGMQEVAQSKKELESMYGDLNARRQNVIQLEQMYQSGQILQQPKAPTKALFDENPLGYVEAKAQYEEDIQKYEAQRRQIAEEMHYAKEAEKRAKEYYTQQEAIKLLELVPELKDPKQSESLKTRMYKLATEYYGYTHKDMEELIDSRAARILADATKYRNMMDGKSKAEAKVKGAKPVIKPGAKKVENPRQKAMERQRAKFKQSGRIEDALSFIVNE